jgi:hypothetical protein
MEGSKTASSSCQVEVTISGADEKELAWLLHFVNGAAKRRYIGVIRDDQQEEVHTCLHIYHDSP